MRRAAFPLTSVFLLAAFPDSAFCATILSATHNYDWGAVTNAVSIDVLVTQASPGGNYLWTYTVTNNGFNPSGGNGFSGFELALPADLANMTLPNANWLSNCCSGEPEEWDIPDTVPNATGSSTSGPGILVGASGIFSFTSLPRTITNSTGYFHTWVAGSQSDVTSYSGLGPEVPNVLVPPTTVPEPSTLVLLGAAFVALIAKRRNYAPR